MAEKGTVRKAAGRKLTQEQKDQVIALALQGLSIAEVARQLGADAQRVSGVVRAARNAGKLPPDPGKITPPVPVPPNPGAQPPAVPPAAGAEGAQQQPASGAAPEGDLGYSWTPNPSGSFTHPAQTITYVVHRLAPQNEGYIGEHKKEPSDGDIARAYGHGTYQLTKQVPGRLPESRDISISRSFGEPRNPRDPQPSQSQRPGYPQRPWQRGQYPGSEGAPMPPLMMPPQMAPPRPVMPPQPAPQPNYDEGRRFEEFARRSTEGVESVAVKVVDKLSDLQEKTLERMESQASRGPDTFLRDFFTEQRKSEQRTSAEERAKSEERRTDERTREESRRDEERGRDAERRRDDEEKHRRWQQDQDKRHDRDMERIKEERATMIGLEERKLALIKEESKSREDMLRGEIANHRARIEEIQAESEGRISEMQESLKLELERGRLSMDKEHEIRSRALTNEHELKTDMVELKGEVIKAQALATQSGDDWGKMLTTLGDGVKDVLGKLVDLKKFQMATPEDRAAEMSGYPVPPQGDVQTIPSSATPESPAPAPRPMPAASPNKEPGGNGHTRTTEASGVPTVEGVFQESLKEPVAQYILKEWGLTLTQGNDPTMFTNTFMEFMKDESPNGAGGRKACAAFAQLMGNRDWSAMKPIIVPALPEDIKAAFDLPGADAFYNAFRVMVCSSIQDYWTGYLQEKQRVEAERRAAQGQPATPAPQPEQEAPPQDVPETTTDPGEDLVLVPEEAAAKGEVPQELATAEAPAAPATTETPAEPPTQEADQGGEQPTA